MLRVAFEPCIPTRGTKVPAGPDWIHEIKHDGYRLIVARTRAADSRSPVVQLACGLVEQLIEFARRELAAPAIRNANSVSGCFELAGFGNRDHRIDSVRLVASTVF